MPLTRFGQPREQVAHQFERAGVGGRIAAGRVAQRRLVDTNHFVDVSNAVNAFVTSWFDASTVQSPSEHGIKNAVDQRALSRSARAGDDGQHAQRDSQINAFQIVFSCPDDRQARRLNRTGRASTDRRCRGAGRQVHFAPHFG